MKNKRYINNKSFFSGFTNSLFTAISQRVAKFT